MRVGTIALGRVLANVVEAIDREFGEHVDAKHWSALTAEAAIGSETHLLETFARNVNKWTAIEALCTEYGIDPAETAAVGDGLNDLEMITHAGLSIAMGNADPRIAGVAKAQVGHHEQSGFAEAADLVLRLNRG